MTTIELAWGPVHDEMAHVLAVDPPDIRTVLDQLARLQDILERVPPDFGENPVADFNRLYRTITASIDCHLRAGDFADPVFLELLDVEFAKRYLVALRMWSEASAETPWAWSVLFRRLRDRTVRALPSAAAGVNAHINYDLPFALVTTWDKLGSRPCDGPQHDDYLLINEVFFDAIPGLRRGYLENWQLLIDRLNGKLDDWYQDMLVEVTRNLAWHSAERIWTVRHQPLAVERIRHSLDRNAALLGCALLSPFCSFLQ